MQLNQHSKETCDQFTEKTLHYCLIEDFLSGPELRAHGPQPTLRDSEVLTRRITKPGFRSALRIWGIPTGTKFRKHLEKTTLLNGPHRRRSRQWPLWVKQALPHAEIYAGWNEVGIPELRSRPDGLAWGRIDQAETLFWLEVETTKTRGRIEQTTSLRWAKAKGYAKAVGVHLVFVVMGMLWIQNVAQEVFTDIPSTCAVIITGWHRLDFGKLPYPKWGELVAARYPKSRKHFTFIT